jgi:enamine deaminase RidA (YjgF/YER057c/UK114 family)
VSREAVPGPSPSAPYSPGIVAEGKLVFVSGQSPLRDGVYVPGTIDAGLVIGQVEIDCIAVVP